MTDSKEVKQSAEKEKQEEEEEKNLQNDVDVDEKPVKINEDFRNIVVVDNVPVVEESKVAKLQSVLNKVCSSWGNIKTFYLPTTKSPVQTCGFAFIEYENAEAAQKAITEGEGKQFGGQHILRVSSYADFEKTMSAKEEYTVPQREEEMKMELKDWLLDSMGRDQFLVRHGNDTEVYWGDFRSSMGRLCYGGEREKDRNKHWTDSYAVWSPKGTYLTTFHKQGIVVWGGSDFQRIQRFVHPGVRLIDFSPCERFLVTTSCTDFESEEGPMGLVVWEVKTGKMLRGFPLGLSLAESEVRDISVKRTPGWWPVFKWSYDGRYLARVVKDSDMISVYETPGMGLLDKKSIKVPKVKACEFSPSMNQLMYWVPDQGNIPANIAIISIPARTLVREKHLYGVTDVQVFWQSAGEYAACRVTRKKSKKQTTSSFEIFRMKEKSVPIDTFELSGDQTGALFFEPNGHRFAVMHGDNIGVHANISFYSLAQKKLALLKSMETRATHAYWSPTAQYVVLHCTRDPEGELQFFDATSSFFPLIATVKHFNVNDIMWDPSGRYLLTAFTQDIDAGLSRVAKYAQENSCIVWNFQGKKLAEMKNEMTFQVSWRPRPPSLLKKDQVDEKSLREKYWKKFEAEDEKIRKETASSNEKGRQEKKDAWKKYRAKAIKERSDDAAARAELRSGLESDVEEDFETIEVVMEEEVDKKEEAF
eukprot:TRINITY_DN1756_c0_g1_i1.p1 TRINITY_DN1756_c0_g1~~TRINITY_DN1756_c0_g1_i1.p1  ORF type:complete len:703 (+),score=217.81 TRINITY_DN1756_c0_g1_i1:63-2171(+)